MALFDTFRGLDTGKGVAFEVAQSETGVKLVAVAATPNTPPSTFNLISPVDEMVLETIETIDFVWHASSDVEGDSLFYDLNISGASFDTTITHIADTSFKFISQNSLEYNTSYDWTVTVTDGISEVASPDVFSFTTPLPNDISQPNDQIPEKFNLAQNYPNPFNPVTVISWQLAVGSNVELAVYNILGERIETLLKEYQAAGKYHVYWNAAGLPSGLYIYSIQTDHWQDTRKMVLLR